ncbi:phosphoribosyl-AMP cyclohydrolase [Pararhodobacter oceanensis]|uniref:Phosphoribosyl-AMP cyclohydrolase n=1 Tax=Pararhodobacter oceanensis TaxID=2172121 RepID=A0A2T8HQV0_9RHOB|nr:phosphoribosyl-AMP cyclohydrolase [Pararhodobacter oceanensis]PVH27808.1 phosphoribosyl-AMP cyclohydrolase [Pararhodobacter oceanensis]
MITSQDLLAARMVWGAQKVAISKAYEARGLEAARTAALRHLEANYGYDLGPVMFKPTMASGAQSFRPTKAGALAYFCGHSAEYPLDTGFAIRGWRAVDSVTSAELIAGDIAMWMGWIILTDRSGAVTKVDKSFGYQKDAQDVLRIVLHHSSLPYQP